MSGAATAIGIGSAIGGVGSIAAGAMGAGAAKDAASQQSAAAQYAADKQYQASQEALGFQKDQWNTTQQQLAPWINSGRAGLSQLDYLMGLGGPQGSAGSPVRSMTSVDPGNPGSYLGYGGNATYNGGQPPQVNSNVRQAITPTSGPQPVAPGNAAPTPGNPSASPSATQPGFSATGTPPANPAIGSYGSLLTPYGQKFSAPTALDEQNDPGYQARLKLGTDAIQRSAAARGSVVTGGTAQALNTYAQDYASNEYGNVYNRALNTYNTNYNQYNQDQTGQYNKLAALAGLGQQTASTLGSLGANYANSAGNTVMGGANAQANGINNAAAANASGLIGASSAWGGAVQGASGVINSGISQYNQLNQLQYLANLYRNNGNGGTPANNNVRMLPGNTMDTADRLEDLDNYL